MVNVRVKITRVFQSEKLRFKKSIQVQTRILHSSKEKRSRKKREIDLLKSIGGRVLLDDPRFVDHQALCIGDGFPCHSARTKVRVSICLILRAFFAKFVVASTISLNA